jgi:UDP-2,3-diacylglucosamine pyrophosphatase LpxH
VSHLPHVAEGTIALVADLHMAAGDQDRFGEDDGLADTIGELVSSASHRLLRLVLLGDTFDFPAVALPGRRRATPATRPADAVEKLDRILAAHPGVVAALRGVVEAGHRIDVVAGNHDMELLFPAVQARLRRSLGNGPGELVVHPWMLHVPGVLYAEHGEQHHDVNRFWWLGAEWPDGDEPLRVPAGSYVDALAHLHPGDGRGVLATAAQGIRMTAALVAALAALSNAERHREEREHRLTSSPPAGLSPAVVLGIDRTAAATPSSIARRAARMAVGRLRRSRDGAAVPYMQSAAQAVHRVLDDAGLAVPFYVFGHTHVIADVPFPGGAARYLNPGTWSSTTRRVPGGDRRCGVVVIERTPGVVPRALVRGAD